MARTIELHVQVYVCMTVVPFEARWYMHVRGKDRENHLNNSASPVLLVSGLAIQRSNQRRDERSSLVARETGKPQLDVDQRKILYIVQN